MSTLHHVDMQSRSCRSEMASSGAATLSEIRPRSRAGQVDATGLKPPNLAATAENSALMTDFTLYAQSPRSHMQYHLVERHAQTALPSEEVSTSTEPYVADADNDYYSLTDLFPELRRSLRCSPPTCVQAQQETDELWHLSLFCFGVGLQCVYYDRSAHALEDAPELYWHYFAFRYNQVVENITRAIDRIDHYVEQDSRGFCLLQMALWDIELDGRGGRQPWLLSIPFLRDYAAKLWCCQSPCSYCMHISGTAQTPSGAEIATTETKAVLSILFAAFQDHWIYMDLPAPLTAKGAQGAYTLDSPQFGMKKCLERLFRLNPPATRYNLAVVLAFARRISLCKGSNFVPTYMVYQELKRWRPLLFFLWTVAKEAITGAPPADDWLNTIKFQRTRYELIKTKFFWRKSESLENIESLPFPMLLSPIEVMDAVLRLCIQPGHLNVAIPSTDPPSGVHGSAVFEFFSAPVPWSGLKKVHRPVPPLPAPTSE